MSHKRKATSSHALKSKKAKILNDSGQTLEERMELRTGYREVEDETRALLMSNDVVDGGFKKQLDKTDSLHNSVRHTTELLLDARTMRVVGDLGVAEFKGFQSRMGFTADEFAQGLSREFAGDSTHAEQIDWLALGRKCSVLFQSVKMCGFMAGAIAIEHGEKKSIVRHRQANGGLSQMEAVVPATITNTSAEEKSQTDIRVHNLAALIRKKATNDTNFFKVVTNPNSFCETIENIFDASFVVKDGHAALTVSDEGVPMLKKSNPPSDVEMASGLKPKQFVLKLTYDDFIEMQKLCDDSFVEPRE